MNQFNINDYFCKNYNLGNKPAVSKFSITFKKILILLVVTVGGFVVYPIAGVALLALFGFLFIGLPMMKIGKEKAAADEWQNNYNYRKNNWDAEYDKFYNSVVNAFNPKEAGMRKLGLDDEMLNDCTAPFSIYGKKYDSYYRWGKDGVARTNHNEITWLFFSQDQVYIYTLNFKLTEKDKKTENTQEFFYSDIVSVSTGSTSVETNSNYAIDGSNTTVETEEFRLVVPGDKISFAFTSNEVVSQSVQGMKTLIRQKKNG